MSSSRLVSRPTKSARSALRAWTLGPLPVGHEGERWSMPEAFTAPDDGGYTRRRGRVGSYAVLALLLAVLGGAVARHDPFSLGWQDPAPRLTRVLEPSLERVVTFVAAALGGADQSPRGSSSGR
ncbi:MAG: hypothetical protein U0325_24505 [Polyangiales bacterium]